LIVKYNHALKYTQKIGDILNFNLFPWIQQLNAKHFMNKLTG